ncbi:MAG: sugar ABC transporter permease [Anaerolineae bacterium]|nr:sugar ABC transporter permease [Thermoflexales bacterium]MDW8406440.1 sugar ABC transporter permease [Anaerolineae bacterium]
MAQATHIPAQQAKAESRRRSNVRSTLRDMWKHRTDYLFISPFYILFAIFGVYPLLFGVQLSLSRWQPGRDMVYVGLQNYHTLLFTDPELGRALLNTLAMLLWILPTGLGGALILAVMLNAKRLVGRSFFRTLFFLPFVTSQVIVAIVFQQLLDKNYGWVNLLLGKIGIPPIPWLTETIPAQLSITLLLHWMGIGTNVLIFLGALQSIDRELYEAAEIDGASGTQQFFNITLPLIRPVMLFMIITATIGLINLYAPVKLLTNGGPEGTTLTLFMRMIDLMTSVRYGEGAGFGFIIGGIVLLITLIQMKFLSGWWTVEGKLKQ